MITPRLTYFIFLISVFYGFTPAVVLAQRGNQQAGTGTFHNTVPAHPYDILVCRPTSNSVTLSILADFEGTGKLTYGPGPNPSGVSSEPFALKPGKPVLVVLKNLKANTRYVYSFDYTQNNGTWTQAPAGHFQTGRNVNTPYVFKLQADSHLDENTSPGMYVQTLKNMAADSADFLVDLGDTWMTDKYRENFRESEKQYIAQRYYLGMVCKSAALFLTLGNHDGEAGGGPKGQAKEMQQWATTTRKTWYANPVPDGFYSGNTEGHENYYAFEWGSALFVVLDPFRYTTQNRQPWMRTLGNAQYQWLANTLQKSKAALKFIFIHNLVGGADNKGLSRGGAEAARFYEWGGWNADSTDGFAQHRPGWQQPLHSLFRTYGVNAVFHGHDHVYARQELDGIVYQALPQPGAMRYGNTQSAAEYGYTAGTILNAPGYLRVNVQQNTASVEFVQTSISSAAQNRKVLDSYTLTSKQP